MIIARLEFVQEIPVIVLSRRKGAMEKLKNLS